MCCIFGSAFFNERQSIPSTNKAVNCLSHLGWDDFGINKLSNAIFGYRR